MKRFLLKLLPFAVWIFLLMVVLPVVIDPYNVFHAENLRDNGIEPNKNFIKTSYVIHHPDKFDSFMFGSSRVSAIHTDTLEDYRCYNMTYSEGVPKEHLQNLQVMIKHGVIPKMVIIGLDNISFMVDPQLHVGSRIRAPYPVSLTEWPGFYLEYLEPIMAVDSLKTTLSGDRSVAYNEDLFEVGWDIDYVSGSAIDWSQAQANWEIYYENRTPETLEEIRQLKELCDENGIRLILFTNPMHPLTYEKTVENGYAEFLEGLAEISDFYNFSGYNDVTMNNENYLETSHYKAHVGDMIMDVIFRGKSDPDLEAQGFGVLVTKENCAEFLESVILK